MARAAVEAAEVAEVSGLLEVALIELARGPYRQVGGKICPLLSAFGPSRDHRYLDDKIAGGGPRMSMSLAQMVKRSKRHRRCVVDGRLRGGRGVRRLPRVRSL